MATNTSKKKKASAIKNTKVKEKNSLANKEKSAKELVDNKDNFFNKIKRSKYATKKSVIICIAILLIIIVCFILSFKNRDLDTIALDTHANEVSEWEYEIKDKDIIKFEKKERVGDIEGKTKEGLITEYYTFKALKEGKTTIKFTFKNKNNGSYGEINEYNVVVDKNNKLTITKIDYSK